jgi:hypothetical protein
VVLEAVTGEADLPLRLERAYLGQAIRTASGESASMKST